MECPECGGPMRRTIIHEIESWECPVDGYAFDAEQSDVHGAESSV